MNKNSMIATNHHDFFLRLARPTTDDCELVVEYLRLLGEHQKTPMTKNPNDIRDLIIAEKCEIYFGVFKGSIVGVNCISEITAVCAGVTGFYMEGFYIEEAFRGNGFGKIFMAHMSKLAVERGHKRLQWFAMDGNESGNSFYKSIGSVKVNAMSTYRLNDEAIQLMAKQFPGPTS